MNFQKTHIKSSKFTLQNVINIKVWFGSCDAFTPRPSWVLTAALFREWSVEEKGKTLIKNFLGYYYYSYC